jgi:hypothetical protein
VVFLASATLTTVFFINFCGWIYACGCHSLWAGAALYCNIHTAGVRHCPWCSYGATGYRLALAAVLAPQVIVSFWNARWRFLTRLALAVAAFPLMGALVAGFYGLISGYWRS